MKFKKMSYSWLYVVLIVGIIFLACASFIVTTSAQENNVSPKEPNQELENSCESFYQSYVSFETTQIRFSNNEKFVVTYYVYSEDYITDVEFTQNGFDIISVDKDEKDANRVVAEVLCIPTLETHSLSIQISLSSNEVLSAILYAIESEYGTFISPFSEDDAHEKCFDYMKKNNLMTQEEYDFLQKEYSKIHTLENITRYENASNNRVVTTTTRSSSETVVEGTLIWKDDFDNLHPLRRVMVQIYDKELVGSQHLATVYTDDDGYFSYCFSNPDDFWNLENGGYDIFIKIYAGDGNILVYKGGSGEVYCKETNVLENVSTGEIINFDFIFTMSFDLGKAFQISQAMITARDYALNMVGNSFDDIAIYYPLGDICSYYDSNKTIRITGTPRKNTQVPNSYASWDVLMHEYGHHIQYQMNIINSPKGDHYIDVNHSDDRKNKDEGVRLAWAEAWPTAFAMVAQSYWKSNLSNIRFINDNTYDAYNFDFPYEIENNLDFLGDACESSIIAVLWDLFDATEQNNSYDTINLGYREFWNVTTGNNVTTFSGFINYFYQLYPNYIQDIGLNLTYHKMASSAPTAIGGTQVDPPTFSWHAQGGSNIFPNNCFYLIFFNKFGDEIHKTASITTTTYTLTQDEWSYILYSLGQEYMVAVSSSQTSTPVTGEYISCISTFTKPTPSNFYQTINMSSNTRYLERVLNFQPGEYVEFKLKFATGGLKLLQTFGNNDAMIYLYDQNGIFITYNKNSGYGNNALLSYYFNSNIDYYIVVKFYSQDQYGELKFSITPANGAKNSGASHMLTYEDIYAIQGHSSFTFNSYASPYFTRVLTFTPPTTGSYTIQIQSDYDTYLYVIDPRSTQLLVNHVNYDDDSGDGYNAKLTLNLDANIPYLIIYCTFDPSAFYERVDLTVKINKNS